MGNFCTKCGRPLEESEVCNCENGDAIQQVSQETNVQSEEVKPEGDQSVKVLQPECQQETYQEAQLQFEQKSIEGEQSGFDPAVINSNLQQQSQKNVAPDAFGLYIRRFFMVARKTVKSPASMLKSFVKANDYKVGLGFIGVDSIIFALFITLLFGKINSAISDFSSTLGIFSSIGISASLHFPLAKIFFATLILTFCGACVLAGILLFFTKVIFKYKTNYKQMLCVASAKNLASVPFALIACIVLVVVPSWSLYIISFGTLLGYFYVVVAMKGTGVVDEDKLTYILFFSFAAMVIVSGLVMRVAYKMYLPSAFTSSLNGMRSFRGFNN